MRCVRPACENDFAAQYKGHICCSQGCWTAILHEEIGLSAAGMRPFGMMGDAKKIRAVRVKYERWRAFAPRAARALPIGKEIPGNPQVIQTSPASEPRMSIWYAVRSATRREKAAIGGLTEQGFAVFMPCETLQRKLGGAMENVNRPLFPGYLFILCEPADFRQILEVEGVHQFVRFGTGDDLKPFPFPIAEIIALQAAERAGEFDRTRKTRAPYRPRKGDKVQVIAGDWYSYVGKVLDTPTGSRAMVKIEGPFGRGVALDVAHLAAA